MGADACRTRANAMALALLAVLAVGSAACGSSGDGSPGAPVDEPPWGLDTIDLPDDAASVGAVLAAMPERVAGLARLQLSPNEVRYEGDTFIRAALVRGDPDDLSVLERLRLLSEGNEVEVEQEELDEGARLVYLIANTFADSEPAYIAAWGAPHSELLFASKGNSPESRKALVQAFVAAACLVAVANCGEDRDSADPSGNHAGGQVTIDTEVHLAPLTFGGPGPCNPDPVVQEDSVDELTVELSICRDKPQGSITLTNNGARTSGQIVLALSIPLEELAADLRLTGRIQQTCEGSIPPPLECEIGTLDGGERVVVSLELLDSTAPEALDSLPLRVTVRVADR